VRRTKAEPDKVQKVRGWTKGRMVRKVYKRPNELTNFIHVFMVSKGRLNSNVVPLNKSSCLAPRLGVTKFVIVADMTFVTLFCAA
jgi:hypothetical protein